MNAILQILGNQGLIPVVKLAKAEDAVPLAVALSAGGIDAVEVTFRSDAAAEAIRRLSAEAPGMLVGAGTVVNRSQLEQALLAGARFVVAPDFDDEVARACLDGGVPYLPGVDGAAGVAKAARLGLPAVKFFPAEQCGGLAMIEALAAPFEGMLFVPTGGVQASNLAAYAQSRHVLAAGGSWMVKPELIAAGNWAEITRLSAQAMAVLHGFQLARVAIDGGDPAQAATLASLLGNLFGLPVAGHAGSSLLGPRREIEVLHQAGRGAKGHLAFSANKLERAVHFLAAKGVDTVADSAQIRDGRLVSVFLDLDLNGFAVQLVAN